MKDDLDTAVARLDDYVRGQLTDELAEAYEDELFARALSGAAPELAFRARLGDTLRSMRARGTLDMWLTAREAEQLSAGELRVRHFDFHPASPGAPDLSGEFDLLITRGPIDLTGVERLDAEVFTPTGELIKARPDISFDPADGAVYLCCEAALARVAATVQTVTRVWARGNSGRRLLAELGSPGNSGV